IPVILGAEAAEGRGVPGCLDGLAGPELRLADGLVGARAGDPDGQQHDRGVDDIAAVAAAVACDELGEGGGPRAARQRAAGARGADEPGADPSEPEISGNVTPQRSVSVNATRSRLL